MCACKVIDVETTAGLLAFKALARKSEAYWRGRGMGEFSTRNLLATLAFNLRLPKPSPDEPDELCLYQGDLADANTLDAYVKKMDAGLRVNNAARVEWDALYDVSVQRIAKRWAPVDSCAAELLNRSQRKAGAVDDVAAAEYFRICAAESEALGNTKHAKLCANISGIPSVAAKLLAPSRVAMAPEPGSRKPPRPIHTRKDTAAAQVLLREFQRFAAENPGISQDDKLQLFADIASSREGVRITPKNLRDRLRRATKQKAPGRAN